MNTILNADAFLSNGRQFAEKLWDELTQSLDGAKRIALIDHLCYRVASVEAYENYKMLLDNHGECLAESFVNGRPIATYRLNTPIRLRSDHEIHLVELPAPKPNASYNEGWEHFELVIPEALAEFVERHSQHNFDLSNMKAAINADVSLRLASGAVKFHASPLDQVIEEEQCAIKSRSPRPLVLFDFDETIVASKEAFLYGISDALSDHLGRTVSHPEVFAAARPSFAEFFGALGVTGFDGINSVVERFQIHWPKYEGKAVIASGMRTFLSCLKYEGFDVDIWTARDELTATKYIDDHGLRGLIRHVHGYSGNEFVKPKPSADLCKLIEKAGKVIVIGDSATDRDGAAKIGAEFLQAAWIDHQKLGVNAENVFSAPLDCLKRVMKIV